MGTLGQSPTMKDVYGVFAHGVKFIMCANDGMCKVSSLGGEGKGWIRGNTVYVCVAKREPIFRSPYPEPAVAAAREAAASAPSRVYGARARATRQRTVERVGRVLARGAA